MVLRKRSSAGAGLDDGPQVPEVSETCISDTRNEDAQEIMKDNLEIMRDVVMRIRDDPEFAKGIYVDCPRLQHKLDERPDLRPIFEDPHLVAINFEEVYREAGGVLPEDEEAEKSKGCFKTTLAKIVNSPLFKVLRVLLLAKKVFSCITGGGISMVRGCFAGLCFDSAADVIDLGDLDADADAEGDGAEPEGNPKNLASKEALNKAADHMEEPEVQEQMNDLLQNDPDGLEDAIENDKELRALRDSNALCAELMSDPETMKILVDPDNLRALGECPDLIEQDFANPEWSPPADIEMGQVDMPGESLAEGDLFPEGDVNAEAEGEMEALEEEYDEENPEPEEEDAEEEEEEEEEEENLVEEYELGEAEEGGRDGPSKSANKSKQQQKKQQNNNNGGGGGGFFSQVGAGLTDLIAAELVGNTIGDVMPGDDMGDLEDLEEADVPGEDAADGAENAANAAENANAMAAAAEGAAELAENDDLADNIEGGLDTAEDAHEDTQEDSDKSRAKAGAAGAAGGLVAGGVGGNNTGKDADEEEEEEEEEPEKKGRFAFMGGMAAAISTAAKETVAGAFLGDDLAEYVVEKQEEAGEDDEDEDEEEGKEKAEDEKEEKKRRGLFRRKR